MCRKKKHLYKKAKKSNSEDHWVAYHTLNNSLKKKCNSAKWSHFEALADKLQVEKNSKPFWNYTRSIRKGTNDLLFLKEGSAEIAGDQEIAQHMYLHMNTRLFRNSIMFSMKSYAMYYVHLAKWKNI